MKQLTLSENLKRQIADIPHTPGVYLMRDHQKSIIYIGKAKDLSKRVKSYFRASKTMSLKTKLLTEKITSLEWITTDSEIEALMLESNMIKKHQPYFNVILKDDKHFPFLRLTLDEDFPRLIKTRKVKKDGSQYFGPYIPEGDANRTLALVKKVFPLRRCQGKMKVKSRPCLNYEMGQCSSPCTGKISKEEYRNIVRDVRLFLDGRMEDLIKRMEEKMFEASHSLNFEEAGRLRDQIKAVRNSFHRHKIIAPNLESRDLIGFAHKDDFVVIEQFFVRKGRLLGRKKFVIEKPNEVDESILRSFLLQIYSEDVLLPPEIVVPFTPVDCELLTELLSKKVGKKISMFVPKRGKKRAMLDMVQKNTELSLMDTIKTKNIADGPRLMNDIASILDLDKPPVRIEAFDISNIGGVMAVGSLVVWEDNSFNKREYRRYKIQTVVGSNDVKMMEEVVERRFHKLLAEDRKLPDIVLLDGGIAQVNIIKHLFEDMGLQHLSLIGLAKGRSKRKLARSKRPVETEYLVFPNLHNHTYPEIPENVLHFFQRIRDEAHRFAIEYHRKLREKLHFRSILDEIPGVGGKRKKRLFAHFGSLQAIMKADEKDLYAVRGIDRRTARTIHTFFQTLQNTDPG